MDYLQSFSIRDFLIFSPESYFKLFELSNQALWPFHIAIALMAVAILFLLYKRYNFAPALIYAWLGMSWVFVGYWYFNLHYSQISTYAHILSYIFWAEACLLFLVAVFSDHDDSLPIKKWRWILGEGLILYGLLLHPVVSLLLWNQALIRVELFSTAPDPTAIATIGFVLMLPVKGYLLLVVIPSLWLIFSFITYQAF